MANLIASPAQMALKLLEVEERLEKVEKELQTLKAKNGKKTKKNLGCAGTYNGNGRIITQFLVSQTHYSIFNFLFNPKIKNWYLDDHLNELYNPNFLHVVNKRCMNVGGEERYTIEQAPFYKDLVREDKEKLISWIKINGGFSHYRGTQRAQSKAKS